VIEMQHSQDRLTLESLLADPLTRLVMRSDGVTLQETARAFHEARAALHRQRHPAAAARRADWRAMLAGPDRHP
jgi:hypothetical protein